MRNAAASGSTAIVNRPHGRSQARSRRRVRSPTRKAAASTSPIALPAIIKSVERTWATTPCFFPRAPGAPLTPRMAMARRRSSTFMPASPRARPIEFCSSREQAPNQRIDRKHPQEHENECDQHVEQIFLHPSMLESPDPVGASLHLSEERKNPSLQDDVIDVGFQMRSFGKEALDLGSMTARSQDRPEKSDEHLSEGRRRVLHAGRRTRIAAVPGAGGGRG